MQAEAKVLYIESDYDGNVKVELIRWQREYESDTLTFTYSRRPGRGEDWRVVAGEVWLTCKTDAEAIRKAIARYDDIVEKLPAFSLEMEEESAF